MLRTQIFLAPAFFLGFLGKDLMSGSLQSSKLIASIVIYGVINLTVYLVLKSKFNNRFKTN